MQDSDTSPTGRTSIRSFLTGSTFRNRPNMIHRAGESWRPPLFEPPETLRARVSHRVRNFFDLQAGSLWRDLAAILPNVEGTVLDVGCGAQPYRGLLSPRATYRGIDTADVKESFGYEVPDTEYFSGDTWPIGDESVACVLATETMEHVLDSHKFLSEAARVLSQDGLLVLTVPFAARWHFIPHDYWRFTPAAMQQLLDTAGFGNINVFARGNEVTVACYKVMALILRLLMPQAPSSALAKAGLRLLGLAASPTFVTAAVIANVSLLGAGGDDCLGYTIIATKEARP